MARLFRIASATALVGVTLATVPVSSDSLYVPGKSRSMFSDRRARNVGDLVTVLVSESTVAIQDASSSTDRKLQAQVDAGVGGPFNIFRLIPNSSLSGATTSKGSGSTSRTTKVASTITCRIKEVTPGGQLVLIGDRTLRINADTQSATFTGIVRPEDIEADNTVSSNQVADARIEINGKGPISRHVKPGILSQIFRYLF